MRGCLDSQVLAGEEFEVAAYSSPQEPGKVRGCSGGLACLFMHLFASEEGM